jgi:molybdenum cofactor cytidylyltransferase
MGSPVTGLWTVVLAAGGSTRFGSPKQLLRLHSQTLIRRSADLARSVAPGRVVIVVGAAPFRLRNALYRGTSRIRVVANPHWQDGMSGSLRRGLRALPQSASAALLLSVDQPLVAKLELRRLIAAWSHRPMRPAASAYAGRLGIPAILPRRFWLPASRADGDIGARDVLRDPGLRVTAVDMPEGAIDIDTREDLDRLTSLARTRVNPFRRASHLAR